MYDDGHGTELLVELSVKQSKEEILEKVLEKLDYTVIGRKKFAEKIYKYIEAYKNEISEDKSISCADEAIELNTSLLVRYCKAMTPESIWNEAEGLTDYAKALYVSNKKFT